METVNFLDWDPLLQVVEQVDQVDQDPTQLTGHNWELQLPVWTLPCANSQTAPPLATGVLTM
jgi:hypothetical protein